MRPKLAFENPATLYLWLFCRRKGTACTKDRKSKSYHEKRHPNSSNRSEIVEKSISGVEAKQEQKLYAIKVMKKSEMVQKNMVSQVRIY